MALAELIPLVLKTSVMTMIFALGLTAAPAGLIYLLRRPTKLLRSLASMYGVMLIVAVTICKVVGPNRAVEVVIVLLSLASIPPLLPKRLIKAGGDPSYAVGLVVAAALFSVVWIPQAAWLLQNVFHLTLAPSSGRLATLVFLNILMPLTLGVMVHSLAPTVAQQLQPILARVGGLMLLAVLMPIFYKLWQPMLSLIGGGTVLVLATFILVGLLSGHLLGGPGPEDRTVLAIASASRHPGITITLAHLYFPNEKEVIAVVLIYLLLTALLALPYVVWRKRVTTG